MKKHVPIVLGSLLLVAGIWLQTTTQPTVTQLIDRLENLIYDMQLHARTLGDKKQPDTPVAIVDVDDKSIAKIGRWPWPRNILATLVTNLKEAGAAVIAIDMLFPENESNIAKIIQTTLIQKKLATPQMSAQLQKVAPEFDADGAFARSFQGVDVILGVTFNNRSEKIGVLPEPFMTLPLTETLYNLIELPGYIANIDILQKNAKSAGFINIFPDEDGIIRRVPLVIRHQTGLYPSLALEAVRTFLLEKIQLKTGKYLQEMHMEGIKIGPYHIATDEKGEAIIPFRGKSFTFPTYSATDVLRRALPPDALRGKIIFIGSSATGLGDIKATAIQNVYPGVEIHATVAASILDNYFPARPTWAKGTEVIITVITGIIFIVLFSFLGPGSLTLLSITVPVLFLIANDWLIQKTGLIISVLIPVLLVIALAIINIIYGYFFETRRREHLKEMFGEYVPEAHINEMLQNRDKFSLQGQSREMTVLFADIRNFTAISEGLSAENLKKMLDTFLTPMTEIIFKHQGTIDKYVGDMIMAFWGAPLTDKNHEQHAIEAALEMQNMITQISHSFNEKGWPEIKMGIGINSGRMTVGDMGSKYRRNYTVLGDAVNLASRVEGLTKFYGVKILVTENTQKNQTDFIFRKLGRVRVKGKINSIMIYEVLCKKVELKPELEKELQQFHQALDSCLERRFTDALQLFKQLCQAHPQNSLYKLYLHRIETWTISPPPADWDGVFIHNTK